MRQFRIDSIKDIIKTYNSSKEIGVIKMVEYEIQSVVLEKRIDKIIPDIKR